MEVKSYPPIFVSGVGSVPRVVQGSTLYHFPSNVQFIHLLICNYVDSWLPISVDFKSIPVIRFDPQVVLSLVSMIPFSMVCLSSLCLGSSTLCQAVPLCEHPLKKAFLTLLGL